MVLSWLAVAAPLHGEAGLLDELALLSGGLLIVAFTLWFLLRKDPRDRGPDKTS